MKNQNLITEINNMRSMMGLKHKSLILENAIIGLAKAFGTFAARHADDVTKIFDDFLEVSAGGSGSLAGANRLKTLLDDLDSAVRAGDDLLVKRTINSMLSDADFGVSVSKRLIDDIFADTAGDALKAVLTKKANGLSGRGLTDDLIMKALKEDMDTIFSDLPATFINAAKNKLDNTISWSSKGSKIAKDFDANDVYEILGQSETWRKFTSKFPGLRSEMGTVINGIIEGGAKTADEVANVMIKQAESKLSPTVWKRIKAIALKNPKAAKATLVIISIGVLRYLAGATGVWNQIKLVACDIWFGKADEDCQEFRTELEKLEEEMKNKGNTEQENNNNGVCDADLVKFKKYLEDVGIDATDATFDTNSCTGQVSGGVFEFKNGQFI